MQAQNRSQNKKSYCFETTPNRGEIDNLNTSQNVEEEPETAVEAPNPNWDAAVWKQITPIPLTALAIETPPVSVETNRTLLGEHCQIQVDKSDFGVLPKPRGPCFLPKIDHNTALPTRLVDRPAISLNYVVPKDVILPNINAPVSLRLDELVSNSPSIRALMGKNTGNSEYANQQSNKLFYKPQARVVKRNLPVPKKSHSQSLRNEQDTKQIGSLNGHLEQKMREGDTCGLNPNINTKPANSTKSFASYMLGCPPGRLAPKPEEMPFRKMPKIDPLSKDKENRYTAIEINTQQSRAPSKKPDQTRKSKPQIFIKDPQILKPNCPLPDGHSPREVESRCSFQSLDITPNLSILQNARPNKDERY